MPETRLRSFRCPDAVWEAAIDRADRTGESVTGALVAFLREWGSAEASAVDELQRLNNLASAEAWVAGVKPARLERYYADRDYALGAPRVNVDELRRIEDELVLEWRARS